jgi:hypothetical protein
LLPPFPVMNPALWQRRISDPRCWMGESQLAART